MDTFSWALFFHSGLGTVLAIVGVLGGLLSGLFFLTLWFRGDKKDSKVAPVVMFLFLIGAPMAIAILGPAMVGSYGRITSIWLTDEKDPLMQVSFSVRTKHGSRKHERVFDATSGEHLAHVARNKAFGRHKVVFSDGGIEVQSHRKDDYRIVDWRTKKELANISALLTKKHQKLFRILKVSDTVQIEFQDGTQKLHTIDELMPKRPKSRKLYNLYNSMGCSMPALRNHRYRKKDKPMGKLFRARMIMRSKQPCALTHDDKPVTLVLHYSTKFGPGEQQLSLVDLGTFKPIWTISMTPWVQSDTTFRLVDVRQKDHILTMWLIRTSRSIARVSLDMKTGKWLSSKVLF